MTHKSFRHSTCVRQSHTTSLPSSACSSTPLIHHTHASHSKAVLWFTNRSQNSSRPPCSQSVTHKETDSSYLRVSDSGIPSVQRGPLSTSLPSAPLTSFTLNHLILSTYSRVFASVLLLTCKSLTCATDAFSYGESVTRSNNCDSDTTC